MPNYRLNDDQAKGLALLMLSWQRIKFPPEYLPAARLRPAGVLPVVREVPYPPPATADLSKRGRYVFMNRGCNSCATDSEHFSGSKRADVICSRLRPENALLGYSSGNLGDRPEVHPGWLWPGAGGIDGRVGSDQPAIFVSTSTPT